MFLTNVDLHNPLTDHPFWRDVRGVWLPMPELAVGSSCKKLYDLSPYRNHATQATAGYQPTWKATSRGLGLDFDGLDDHLRNAYPLQSGATDATLITLMRHNFSGESSTRFICGLQDSALSARYVLSHAYYPGATTGTKYQCFVQGSASGSQTTHKYDETNLPSNTWTLSCFAFTASSKSISLWLDGEQQSPSDTTQLATGVMSSKELSIARDPGDTARDFPGDIGLVLMLSRAITASEAAFFHDQSLKGYPDLIRQTTGRTTCYITSAGASRRLGAIAV